MRMIAKCLATTSLVWVSTAAAPVWAADVETTSTVDAVTVYPDGASVTRVITVDLAAGDNTLVARIFRSGWTRRRCGSRARRTQNSRSARSTPSRRAPRRRSICPSIDRRIEALKDQRVNLRGRDRCCDRAPQIRRAFCRGLAGRVRREGRGAPDRGMARGLCRRVGRSRRRRRSDPRGRAQAARRRSRDREARGRSRRSSRRASSRSGSISPQPRDHGDVAGDLCGAQCALDAAL